MCVCVCIRETAVAVLWPVHRFYKKRQSPSSGIFFKKKKNIERNLFLLKEPVIFQVDHPKSKLNARVRFLYS